MRRNVVSMIERCPSGALTVRFEDEADIHELETQPTIAIVDDGPLWVIGSYRSPWPMVLVGASQPGHVMSMWTFGHKTLVRRCAYRRRIRRFGDRRKRRRHLVVGTEELSDSRLSGLRTRFGVNTHASLASSIQGWRWQFEMLRTRCTQAASRSLRP